MSDARMYAARHAFCLPRHARAFFSFGAAKTRCAPRCGVPAALKRGGASKAELAPAH